MMEKQTYTIVEVSQLLGISRNSAYSLARTDTLPVKVLKLGKRMVVSKLEMTRLLGAATDGGKE
jgi:predicted DNA-binding transcriptional regulator AlpA